ncbi:hypothetical protein Tco_1231685 [Tanacetum coccineum]
MTDSVNEPRGVLETLCPGIKISSGVIDIFTKVLNHAKLYRDPWKSMRKVFFETSMMQDMVMLLNIWYVPFQMKLLFDDSYMGGEVCRFPRIPKPSSTRSNEDCCMHDPKVGVYDKENFIDRGIFAMCHMETYMGGGEYDDLCRLRRECKAQKLQLDELRMK